MAGRILEFWRMNSPVTHCVFGTAWFMVGYTTLSCYRKRLEEIILCKENVPVEVDDDTLSMSQEVVEKTVKTLKAPGADSPLLGFPIVTVDSDVVGFGSMKNRFGGVVGVPYSWRYSTSQEIESVSIALRTKPSSYLTKWIVKFNDYVYATPKSASYEVITAKPAICDIVETDENNQAMEDLKESLILSKNAKVFAYLRGVGHVNSHHYDAVVWSGVASVGMGCTIGYVAQMILQIKSSVKPKRILPFVVLAHVVGYKISLDWFKDVMDMYLKKLDTDIDQDLVKQGLTEGGIEFYEKLIQKNKSVRTLVGYRGEQLYTDDGNVIYPNYRTPHLQLTQQRDNLIKQLESTDSD